MRLAPSLVDRQDATHREALRVYSWGTIEWALKAAAEPWVKRATQRVERELAEVREARDGERVHAGMSDAALRVLAERRAGLMRDRIAERVGSMTVEAYAVVGREGPVGLLAWINDQLDVLDSRPLAFGTKRTPAEQLPGIVRRAGCPLRWRRQLRRAVVARREAEAIKAGEVCATRRQPYVSDDTIRRLQALKAAHEAMLQATHIESADGDTVTVWDAMQASVSNKAIRRGELMTRIRGCEELADELGHAGVFLTLTAPSRFHRTLRHGAPNPKWAGAMPRDSHKWLGKVWEKARARLCRLGVKFYGFRVAEPHHDGTTHWHALLWTSKEQSRALLDTLKKWWLKDDGDEPGAERHRCRFKRMVKGGASGYVAKYIAKNIDDAGAVGDEGHTDWGEAVPMPAQQDMFGGAAQRVAAWSSAHGIRQFQPLGQPPVTLWRELRRISAEAVAGASDRVKQAHAAAHRDGTVKASWAGFVRAAGGLTLGRCYLLKIATRLIEREGRYERAEVKRPMGVEDVERPGEWVLSSRKEWRPRGAWTDDERRSARPQAARPWTRFNNCTRRNGEACYVAGRFVPRGAPLMTWRKAISTENRRGEGAAGSFNDPPESFHHGTDHHPPS